MLLYGIAAVAVLWWFMSNFAHANPATLARFLKVIGGVVALCLAGLLAVRGRIDMALLIGSFGAWLLGWNRLAFPSLGGRAQRASGHMSRVRSQLIQMTLDHDTGEMEGSVLAGAFEGQQLGSLDEARLRDLLAECHARDPDGVRLLEAYLDRRSPRWREHAQTGEAPQADAPFPSGAITPEEAYRILDLHPGASPDEIRQAHRTLMKKLHPDQGGSTYLAARVNQAKDVLLKRGYR
ncbi:DnaJ domain-containing protein [Microvirga lotononidis]|uniref:DnaJ-class molecular chaperone with C-terminal Zn finger domain n=1 Tax=Microvirga lotononidis TaxID=864069 RepID=I4Z220_9HYPH|nr:DnaJ-class molecular chaperone with C-terminal Zn finger domain [Microvirga lotononidis]